MKPSIYPKNIVGYPTILEKFRIPSNYHRTFGLWPSILWLWLFLLFVNYPQNSIRGIMATTNVNSTTSNEFSTDLTSSSSSSLSKPHQISTSSSSLSLNCDRCLNGGQKPGSLVIGQQNRSDCISGHYFRLFKSQSQQQTIINNDTAMNDDRCGECELICAKRSGQPCQHHYQTNHHHHLHHNHHPSQSTNQAHHLTNLCDPYLNLYCNEKTKVCEGHLSLVIDHISTDSFSVQWKTLASSNKNSSEVFIAKYVPQPLNLHFEKSDSKFFESDNSRLNAKIDKLDANTTYIVKVVHNHQEERSIVTTKVAEALPKVLVTYRNATSITIVFDDFKPSSSSNDADNSGYAIHYRPENGGFMQQHNQWLIIKSNATPFYTLTALKPNTNYKIQVFTWSDHDHRQVLSSEIIEAITADGCIFQNRSFEVDEKILEDCEQTCLCMANGSVNCRKRCVAPYLSIKEAKSRNLKCIYPQNGDQCCVQCTGVINETQANFVGKPGVCPVVNRIAGASGNSSSCTNECSHDYHCTGTSKCCVNQCGMFSCQPPSKNPTTIHECPLKCDQNAECRFIEEESAYKCVCLDGSGNADPNLNGCHRYDERKYSCHFNNQNYFIGQTFEHDCHICVCTEALEVECKRKCMDYDIKLVPNHCTLIEDAYDPICCKKQICDAKSVAATQMQTYLSTTNGCRHLNRTYSINETFYIGCQLKCLCQINGEVECSPRCFDDNGYNENYCHLRPDPDDPECCKISICDYNSTLNDHKILIEMAESVNSTAIKFRLLLFSSFNENITVFYHKFLPNQTDSEKVIWKDEQIPNEAITIIMNDSKEIILKNLEPETDYSVYFKAGNDISNTVIVRTFPEGIDHTFKGCFQGSQIIQVGEVFYEGDCEYKCICKEGGIRDCIERCPVYVDMIASDNCKYVPSSEDPCCTVPICENTELSSFICLSEDGKQYKIGDTWTYGTGCLEKTCICQLGKNNITEIKCKNGCPEIPASVLKPTANCPSPQLIHTSDPCACPYVVCANNINHKNLPKVHNPKNYCEYKGNKIGIGEEFYDGCRAVCLCNSEANLDCRLIHCNHNFGPHATKCLEWEIDPLFVPRPPNCCPEPKCKNDGSCSFAGLRIPNYKMIPQELLPCHKRCMCDNGRVHCKNLCPEVPDKPPLGLPCPTALAFRGHLPGDDCCIHWQCRENYRDKIYGKCSYKDKVYKLGEYWDDNETEIHRRCQCKVTNGILHVVCDPGFCQPITERFLEPTAECKTPTVVTPKDAIMCPYVVCNNTGSHGQEIDNIDVVAINSTSVRIRFTVPSIYVGLLGHAEVHYTTDINIARNQWNIQKFARPNRLFDIANIEYHLGNLQPDTTYFLQIEVVIETLRTGPISEIYKIYLPPLPITMPTSTTTTTSTLPPVIMLDMHLSVTNIDLNTVKIMWRPFTSQEKKFIDGLQVRYKKAGQESDSDEWKYSQILHRDSTFYVLNKLEPGLTYVIDLIFTSIDNISANIISSKPLLIEMPLQGKGTDSLMHSDKYHIFPEDVTSNDGKINIALKSIPKPANKFINVAKIHYENSKTMESFYSYVNIDEKTNQISFSDLNPNTRYKLWIELYLTNGKVLTSNTIDLITNFDKQYFKDKNSGLSSSPSHHHQTNKSNYLFGLTILSMIMFVTGSIFLIITCICLRKHSQAAGSVINRVCISEAAYDNPTYKTFERGDGGKNCSNGGTGNGIMGNGSISSVDVVASVESLSKTAATAVQQNQNHHNNGIVVPTK